MFYALYVLYVFLYTHIECSKKIEKSLRSSSADFDSGVPFVS